ncbi:40S ribosomal protein S21 [Liparis tanakae]|uniref:Small ribosomal subunit protein eS21 n=1 Tax=Liparis tanakae TaxID=230148 RepID=A0A4Z2IR93_9TELE|nr:40S ribosomal protein S21 [Liparis tanakae]
MQGVHTLLAIWGSSCVVPTPSQQVARDKYVYFRISSSSFPVGHLSYTICRRPPEQPVNMQNDSGEFVDLYIPRKCSASNRIIGAKDHASVQINIAEVDKVTGRFNGQFKTYAICGAIRRMGESDDSILRLAKNDSVVTKSL